MISNNSDISKMIGWNKFRQRTSAKLHWKLEAPCCCNCLYILFILLLMIKPSFSTLKNSASFFFFYWSSLQSLWVYVHFSLFSLFLFWGNSFLSATHPWRPFLIKLLWTILQCTLRSTEFHRCWARALLYFFCLLMKWLWRKTAYQISIAV